MLSKHKIPCDKLLGSTFRLNKLPDDEWRVRFSAYNENHKKRYVRNISILGNEGGREGKKGKKKKGKKLLLRLADKKLQCTRNAAKNSRYCDFIPWNSIFPLVFAYSLCDKYVERNE